MADIRTVLSAFSEEHAAKLSGVTVAQLRYWDKKGLYQPAYGRGRSRQAFSRIYSFRDIVSLRVLSTLHNIHRVPLTRLREVGEALSKFKDDRWTAVRLWALNRNVIWQEPGTDRPEGILNHQGVVTEVMQAIIAETSSDVSRLSVRDPAKIGKVEKVRYINQNQPVLGGTRIPVAAIREFHKAGYNPAQIVAEYPDLTPKDIKAALRYKVRRAA
jgi:uncharacterized protein (DUF433 family)